MLSPWGRSSPKHLSAWNNSNFLRFVSIKIWVLNFDVFSSTSLMAHKEEPLQGKARKLLTTHHVLGYSLSFLFEHIWNDLPTWYFLLQKGKKYDGRCFCILQIGSFREESESISAQMTHVDNLMSRLITSIAGKYQPSTSWHLLKRLTKSSFTPPNKMIGKPLFWPNAEYFSWRRKESGLERGQRRRGEKLRVH